MRCVPRRAALLRPIGAAARLLHEPCAGGSEVQLADVCVTPHHRRPPRVVYLTDVEGDMNYFQRFISMSRYLRWEPRARARDGGAAGACTASASAAPHGGNIGKEERASLATAAPVSSSWAAVRTDGPLSKWDVEHRVQLGFVDDRTHFVYGGDVFDHGADLAFATALLELRRRFPDRVHFILGNRDINKMILAPSRLLAVSELSPTEAENSVFPLRAVAAQQNGLRQPQQHYHTFLQAQGLSTHRADPVTFLKWALTSRMGSPNAFEHRRRELGSAHSGAGAVAGAASPRSVTDREVLESFMSSALPGGVYHEYLRHGVLAKVLHGTLFVHGGVNQHNYGFLPDRCVVRADDQWEAGCRMARARGDDAAARRTDGCERGDALAWLAALNVFKEESFLDWVNGTGTRGESMRCYVFPRELAPHSVAVGSFVGLRGPEYVTLPVVEYLLESGIHTLCAGHQPTGDAPALVRQPGGFVMIDADNSYCGRGNAFCSASNQRGLAVQEVIFNEDAAGASTRTVVHGRRTDGQPFAYTLEGHPLLGRCVGDDWWVRMPIYERTRRDGDGAYVNLYSRDGDEGSSRAAASIGSRGSGSGGCGDSAEAPYYELCRTRDAFRSDETMVLSAADVRERLRQYQQTQHVPLPGELPVRYTKEELAQVHVHRIKTKVTADSQRAS